MPDQVEIFVATPLAYAHPERVRRLLGGHDYREFAASPEAQQRLNRYAEKTWELGECHPGDVPPGVLGELLMLPGEKACRLGEWCGALAALPRLRLLADGTQMRKLAEELPGVYPQCLRMGGWFKGWQERCQQLLPEQLPISDGKSIMVFGLQMLCGKIRHLPRPILNRWLLRFPKELATLIVPAAGVELPDDDDLSRLMELLQ